MRVCHGHRTMLRLPEVPPGTCFLCVGSGGGRCPTSHTQGNRQCPACDGAGSPVHERDRTARRPAVRERPRELPDLLGHGQALTRRIVRPPKCRGGTVVNVADLLGLPAGGTRRTSEAGPGI